MEIPQEFHSHNVDVAIVDMAEDVVLHLLFLLAEPLGSFAKFAVGLVVLQ